MMLVVGYYRWEEEGVSNSCFVPSPMWMMVSVFVFVVTGVEFQYIPDTGDVPLIVDMSSNILTRTLDISKVGKSIENIPSSVEEKMPDTMKTFLRWINPLKIPPAQSERKRQTH